MSDSIGRSNQALEIVDSRLSVFTDGIIKRVVSTSITVTRIRTILYEELNSLKIAFRGSNTKGGTAIVIVSVDSPALIFQNSHILYIILECSIEKTVVIVVEVLDLNWSVGVTFASLSSICLKKSSYLFIIGIIERS